jgi:isopentenyl phosphate kinase
MANSPDELVFLKLGGSLITDKTREATARPEVIRRLAQEVRAALKARPELRLLLGHGSGSFGHILAHRYHVHTGCTDFWGYAATGAIAARLNRLVTDTFLEEGMPVVSIQPSASARSRGGKLIEMATGPIQDALNHRLAPLVYGDVSFDEIQGSAIVSTEQAFFYLTKKLLPARIILAGEVAGVFTSDPLRDPAAHLIPEITSSNIEQVWQMLSGSFAVDVTGGMLSKVMTMVDLVREHPALTIQIISGRIPGVVQRALQRVEPSEGTLLHL